MWFVPRRKCCWAYGLHYFFFSCLCMASVRCHLSVNLKLELSCRMIVLSGSLVLFTVLFAMDRKYLVTRLKNYSVTDSSKWNNDGCTIYACLQSPQMVVTFRAFSMETLIQPSYIVYSLLGIGSVGILGLRSWGVLFVLALKCWIFQRAFRIELQIVRFWIERGFGLNLQCKAKKGFSPLFSHRSSGEILKQDPVQSHLDGLAYVRPILPSTALLSLAISISHPSSSLDGPLLHFSTQNRLLAPPMAVCLEVWTPSRMR